MRLFRCIVGIASQYERDALSEAGFVRNTAGADAEYWAHPAEDGIEVSILGDAQGWTVALFEEQGDGAWLADGLYPSAAEALTEALILLEALTISGRNAALGIVEGPLPRREVLSRWR
ncbi:hypothetical protein D3C71_328910 [compost metagenome]